MNKTVSLTIGACALGAAALAAVPDAFAQSWSSTIGPNNFTLWSNGNVIGAISTGANGSLYCTSPTNPPNSHTGGYFFQCNNEAFDGWPKGSALSWSDQACRNDHYCQGGNTLAYSFGWVHDN